MWGLASGHHPAGSVLQQHVRRMKNEISILPVSRGLSDDRSVPFSPEPHIVEKLRWVASGAQQMRPIDWFDLFLHGAPWCLLIAMIAVDVVRKVRATSGR